MEKVRPWCGQPSDRGRLKNRTELHAADACSVILCIRLFHVADLRPVCGSTLTYRNAATGGPSHGDRSHVQQIGPVWTCISRELWPEQTNIDRYATLITILRSSITERRVPQLIPVLGSRPAGDTHTHTHTHTRLTALFPRLPR